MSFTALLYLYFTPLWLYGGHFELYNNQINARALIGQSAMGYCARKPMEKSHVFLSYYIKAKDHKFLWVMG